MSELYPEENGLEKRLEFLEGVVAKQDQKIQMLASLLSLAGSSAFDGPLKSFFDEADAYFDYFYETSVPCDDDCSERWRRSDKGRQARENLAECRAHCRGLISEL